jgi:Thioredoxin-like
MKTLRTLPAVCLIVTVGFAQELSWAELAGRPELWPAQCTLKEAIRFQGGMTVAAGQPLSVLQVKASEIELSTADGRTTFAAEPDETDALAAARATYAKLTPRQRQLTYPSVSREKALWPARVTLSKTLELGGGKSARQGELLAVLDVQPDKLLVKSEAPNGTFYVTPPATDLMAQARQFVEDPQSGPRFVVEQQKLADAKKLAAEARSAEEARKAQVRVLGELEGKLVNAVTDKPEPLDPKSLPRYLVFYRGSSTCPITRKVTPTLIKFYRDMKPRHPEFEIIWVMTESPEDTGKFARELGFSWRAVTYESTPSMPTVNGPINGLLPQLFVMDRSGRVLVNALQNAVPAAIKQLDALLKATSGPS